MREFHLGPSFFGDLDREMDRFLEHYRRPKRPLAQYGSDAWRPLVDLFETADMVVAVAELAGVEQDQVEVEVQDRVLVIRGHRAIPSEHQPTSYHVMEINHGAFQRAVNLPAEVDASRTSAVFRNGLLEVCMPKLRPHRIAININAGEPDRG